MEELTLEQLQARLAAAESGKAEAEAKASALQAGKSAAEAKAEQLAADKEEAEMEVSKLKTSRENMREYADKIEAENAELSAVVNAAKAEAKKTAPVEFETEDGDTYEFTCPTFTWDDSSVINVRELEAEAERNEKAAEKYATICANLVARESGIIRKKED